MHVRASFSRYWFEYGYRIELLNVLQFYRERNLVLRNTTYIELFRVMVKGKQVYASNLRSDGVDMQPEFRIKRNILHDQAPSFQ